MTRSYVVPAGGGMRFEHLAGLRAALVRRRRFRREQLQEHRCRETASATTSAPDPRDEVEALVAAAARRALEDIELALAEIRDGRYGRCRVCDAEIPLVVLQAVPQTTECLSCLQATDRPGGSVVSIRPAGAVPMRGGRPPGY